MLQSSVAMNTALSGLIPGNITGISVVVNMSDSYVGNLDIQLVAPAGDGTAALLDLNGDGSMANGGNDAWLSGSDHLNGATTVSVPITYQMSGSYPGSYNMGSGLSGGDIVGFSGGSSATYLADDPGDPSIDTLAALAATMNSNSPDHAVPAGGLWTLDIGMSGSSPNSYGYVDSWTLNIQTQDSPEPASVVVLALGAVGLLLRRPGAAARGGIGLRQRQTISRGIGRCHGHPRTAR
jgi:hypothetical protein